MEPTCHKYLAIKNWDSYQTFTSSGVPAHWIKDYVNADFDEPLAIFEGGLLNRLRRFRGRLGHNIPANLQLVCSGCAVLGQDRHNVGAALVQLVGRGRLIPTNQQDSVSKKRREEKNIEEKIITPPRQENQPSAQEVIPPVPPEESPVSEATADDVTTLCELVSSYSGNVVKDDWAKYAKAILEGTSLEKLRPLLEWMYVESDFWAKCTFNTKNLYDHLMAGSLLKKYNTERALHRKRVEKAKSEVKTSAPGAHGNFSGMEFKMNPEEQFRSNLDFQYKNAVAEIPEKFRGVDQRIQPSPKSRLPLEEQAKLYREITQEKKWNEGWAFFAPAGYGKTTVSWLLYKYAIRENLARAIWTGQSEFTCGSGPLKFYPCYCWHIVLPEYLQQTQASWNDESVERPKLIFDKFAKAKEQGFRPRLFLEEIDKVKEGSEWANNILFTLFNAVDKHKAQLVFDTNLSKQQFLNRFGEPITRRVKENCNVREWGF